MILSHRHCFIFIRATKIAGSSVEVALNGVCGSQDVMTRVAPYCGRLDHDKHGHVTQNASGFHEHMTPGDIRRAVGRCWDAYYKFTVVRNPWDVAVSSFFWTECDARNRSLDEEQRQRFKDYVLSGRYLTNEGYYIDKGGAQFSDFHMMYESLDADFAKLCEILGVGVLVLPRLKSRTRPDGLHYSLLYPDDEVVERVAKDNERTISFFIYQFEDRR